MKIPPNISAIDATVMKIAVIPGKESDPKDLIILSWKVVCKLIRFLMF